MFESTLRLARVGVLAALVLLVAAGPSQAQRGHASFRRGLVMSGAGRGSFHPDMAHIHHTTPVNRRNTAALRVGMRHVHPNGTQFNTLRMTTPQLNMPRMTTPQMVMPRMTTPQMVMPRMTTPQMVMPQLNRGM
jgi:hypothetical protein